MKDYDNDLFEGCFNWHSYHIDGTFPKNEMLVERIQAGDSMAEQMLLSNNERFLNSCAVNIADRYGVYTLADDLKQEGALALLNAARQFDSTCGVKFLTYAYPVVRAAILDYAAGTTMLVRLPTTRYHQVRRVSWIIATVPPWTEDLSLVASVMEQMSVSHKVALSLLQEARNMFAGEQLGDNVFNLNCGGDPALGYTARLRQKHIPELLSMLTPRERMLVEKYCGFEERDGISMTFEELAVRLNFNSPSAAEKAFRRAVSKLSALYGKIGEYGAWRKAEKALREAMREHTEPIVYSTPQHTWMDSALQPTVQAESTRTP